MGLLHSEMNKMFGCETLAATLCYSEVTMRVLVHF